MIVAIYPGSFDPITKGHIHIAERACRMFDQVIIGIADQNYKSTLFALEERRVLAEESVAHLHGCKVVTFDGLTVDLAKKYGANIIIRGLRAVSDYEYEMQVAAINKYLDPKMETVFLMSEAEYSFVSSSIIKQAGRSGANISGLVSPSVELAIKNKFIAC